MVELVFSRQARPVGLSTLEQVRALRDQASGAATAAAADAVAEAMPLIESTISDAAGQAADQAAGLAAAEAVNAAQPIIAQAAQQAADAAAPAAASAIRQEVKDDADRVSAAISSVGLPLGNPLGWVVTRNSRRAGFDAAGRIEGVAPNQLQGGFSPAGDYLGALIEPRRQNLVRANRAEGGIAGVIGSGGQLPTADGTPSGAVTWTLVGNGGLTTEIIGPVVANGMTGIRLRVYGTATSAGWNLHFETSTGAPAQPSRTYTGSFWYRIIASPAPPNSRRKRMIARTATGSAVQSFTASTFSGTSEIAQVVHTEVFPATGTVAGVDHGIGWTLTTGRDYDETFDVFLPQLEEGHHATSPILSVAGIAEFPLRAADDVVAPAATLGRAFSRRSGMVMMDVSLPPAVAGVAPLGIFSLTDGGDQNLIGLELSASLTELRSRWVTEGIEAPSAVLPLSAPAAPARRVRLALSWASGFLQIAARGLVSDRLPIALAVPALSHVALGRSGSLYLSGGVLGAELRPTPVWDTDLATITMDL